MRAAAGKSLMDLQKRVPGGKRARFIGTSHHGNQAAAALRADHAAVVEGRSLFPTRVKQPSEVNRVLIDGHNNAKIGATIEKGPWVGMPVLTLTLEERATCPRTCALWRECMGNAMPMPRRHAHGDALIACLEDELRYYAQQDVNGFAVRLHILGDFYSTDYVAAWARWMREIPQLHVWGYTARQPDTDIGDLVAALNDGWPDRWRVRFSVPADAPIGPMQATTIWRQPDTAVVSEGTCCPQQFSKTATCGTCSLCWAPGFDDTRIVFVGHGMSRRGAK